MDRFVHVEHVNLVHVDERHKKQEGRDGLENEGARRMDRLLKGALASVKPRSGLAIKVVKSLLICRNSVSRRRYSTFNTDSQMVFRSRPEDRREHTRTEGV